MTWTTYDDSRCFSSFNINLFNLIYPMKLELILLSTNIHHNYHTYIFISSLYILLSIH